MSSATPPAEMLAPATQGDGPQHAGLDSCPQGLQARLQIMEEQLHIVAAVQQNMMELAAHWQHFLPQQSGSPAGWPSPSTLQFSGGTTTHTQDVATAIPLAPPFDYCGLHAVRTLRGCCRLQTWWRSLWVVVRIRCRLKRRASASALRHKRCKHGRTCPWHAIGKCIFLTMRTSDPPVRCNVLVLQCYGMPS